MSEQYYKILGVDKNATLEEIKKAYRQKAKTLHPDVNKGRDAQEKFVLLNEAYEYLKNPQKRPVHPKREAPTAQPKKRNQNHQTAQQRDRERSKQRTQSYKGRQQEEPVEEAEDETLQAFEVVMKFLSVLSVVLIFLTPLIGLFIKGVVGLCVGFFIIVISVQYWSDIVYHDRPELNFKELWPAILQIAKSKVLRIALVLMVNLFLAYRIGFNTLITMSNLVILYAAAVVQGYLISTRFRKKGDNRLIYMGLGPGVINLFLLLNFMFSSNVTTETYALNHNLYSGRRSTYITLQGGEKYADYMSTRLFADYEALKYARTITYEFADGLFGLRVMKSYEFH